MEITEKIAKELAKQTVIITTTWYNPNSKVDVVRSKLALITLKTAMELGYTVIVVDSGSSDEFLQEMEQYGVTIIKEPHQTMGHGRRVALREALKTDKN